MIPIFPKPLTGLTRLGLWSWRATDQDPQFLLTVGQGRPPYLVIAFEALDQGTDGSAGADTGATLDPVLYLDDGTGDLANKSHTLRPARKIVCLVALRDMPALRQIRLDPATRPARFRLWLWGVNKERQAHKLATRWLHGWGGGAESASLEIIADDKWGAAEGKHAGRAGLLSLEDHFRHVVALAAALPAPELPGPDLPGPDLPWVSLVVPVYNTPPRYLDDLLASLRQQKGMNAELVLSDDGSTATATLDWLKAHAATPGVVLAGGPVNRGIAAATNAGLAAARSPWVCLVDHDDALAPSALAMVARALQQHPAAQFIYTDEVITDGALRPLGYFLKPAFDPVLLSGVNYINHLSFYRRERLLALGGLCDGFQGSQDYELLLRYLDGLPGDAVVHVPYPAYLWRRDGQSYTMTHLDVATASARRALTGHYQKLAPAVTVGPARVDTLHRVALEAAWGESPGTAWPRVSVIIPNRDAFDLLAPLLDGLAEATDYPDLEVIVVDNGSTDPRIPALYQASEGRFARFVTHCTVEDFNFSRAINRGIALATGPLVLLLNNDIEVIEPGWLKEMVACTRYPATGIVGARLLYPTRRYQHAGVIVGLGGLAGHWYVGEPDGFYGPMNRLAVRQSLSAVTGAAMLISRPCLEAVGRFDEAAFVVAYNDVDYCLRARQAGYRIVWTPFAPLVHHESATRGSDERPETIERFQREQGHLRQRHGTDRFEDPAFNPWYSRDRSNPIYRFLKRLPPPRTG